MLRLSTLFISQSQGFSSSCFASELTKMLFSVNSVSHMNNQWIHSAFQDTNSRMFQENSMVSGIFLSQGWFRIPLTFVVSFKKEPALKISNSHDPVMTTLSAEQVAKPRYVVRQRLA